MIKVLRQNSISELGKRSNNEDNFGYIPGFTNIVCDGVGGAEKGEIASEIVVQTFIDSFSKNPNADASVVLKIAESNISSYINKHENSIGMATTLTFSHVKDDGIFIAWVGDSRVYQFRNGQIIFQTTDHSWINEALRSGIITESEAINHPKANVITRAIQGSHKPTIADTVFLTDIKKGDLFLHCSDGVLESWSNEDLSALFSSLHDPEQILETIKKECFLSSKDNFTAIVFEIDDVRIVKESKSNIPQPYILNKQTRLKKRKYVVIGILFIVFFVATSIYITGFFDKSKKDQKSNRNTEKNIDDTKSNKKETEVNDSNPSNENKENKSDLFQKDLNKHDENKTENTQLKNDKKATPDKKQKESPPKTTNKKDSK